MAFTNTIISSLLSTTSPHSKTLTLHSNTFTTLNLQTLAPIHHHHHRRTTLIITKSSTNGGDSADGPDRLISALCYFYPFFDGIQYGKYVVTQFTFLQTAIQPLVPAIRVFKSFPFNGTLVFLLLYFGVVRNPNFSRYVRFNAMQAVMLDVLLIFPDLLERGFNPSDGFGLDLMMSLDSTVFFFYVG
ncbi:protein TIC 20-v, chloroplastic-like [Bidens hawaiensis]|uniref:protein TIC 20-v, chloroplastic-like n=1 Tax=Bidens hawaiensis TaxID=980011 RepID=UPI00404B73B7